MIDFIKTNITDALRFENNIRNNQIVDLKTFIDTSTGEMQDYPKYGKYFNLDVKINPFYSKLSGSLHKLENMIFLDENQNYNDFTYHQLSSLIPALEETFDLNDNNSLSYLELGLNIDIGFDPKILIDNNLLMYDLKNHNKDLKFKGNGDFKEFSKTDSSLKIYNKSKQYRKEFHLNKNLLRIELKLKSKRKIQSLGIYSINDLLDKNKLHKVFEFLHKEFLKLTLIDNLENISVSPADLEKLNKYTNPNFWQRIRENKSYKIQTRLKKDFDLLLRKYNLTTLKADVEFKLIHKFWELINQDELDLFEPISA
ncbi:hypothetical protein [Flavobacterium tegetincola]|uniref:hypothetical protein n=1 Tax=Flavobacterium tegetincola TaxID=150172 RepID=UPI00041187CF|nr:hypothetical protein [Flavobacterium tegetincola]